MKVTGILKVKYDTQQVSDKYKKRDFVVTIEPTSPYPQHINFQLAQDKCSLIDSYKVGEELTISFNLRGREWNSPQGETKYFNTIEAWRIEKGATGTQSPANPSSHNDDDLPF